MEVRALIGQPLFTVRFTGITASTQIPAALLTLPGPGQGPVRYVRFTGGGTNTPTPGENIVGLTSAATARVLGVAITSGTFAGGDAAGILFVDNQSGTFQAENLDHTNGATDDLTIAANTTVLDCPGFKCRGALMVVETADLRWVEDGATVTETGGANPGFIMGDGDSREIASGPEKLRFINAVGSNGTVLVMTLYY